MWDWPAGPDPDLDPGRVVHHAVRACALGCPNSAAATPAVLRQPAGLAPVTVPVRRLAGRSFIQGGRPRVRSASLHAGPGGDPSLSQPWPACEVPPAPRRWGEAAEGRLTAVRQAPPAAPLPVLEQNRGGYPIRSAGRGRRGGRRRERAGPRRRMTSPWARPRGSVELLFLTKAVHVRCGRARSGSRCARHGWGFGRALTTRGAGEGLDGGWDGSSGARACNAAVERRAVPSARRQRSHAAHDLDVDDCPDFRSPPQRMSGRWSALGKCEDWRDAGFAVRGHRSPARDGHSPVGTYASPEVTLALARDGDHRTYRSAPVRECTDSPPVRRTGASALDPRPW